MKAIRKRDGKEIDVVLVKQAEYLEEHPVEGGACVYYESALILKEAVDWDAFRREAAKDMLASIMAQNGQDFFTQSHNPFIVKAAIDLADELIKQLRGERK